MGVFDQRLTKFGFTRIGVGATFGPGMEGLLEVMFLAEGKVTLKGVAFGPCTAFEFAANEAFIPINAAEDAESFGWSCPRVEPRRKGSTNRRLNARDPSRPCTGRSGSFEVGKSFVGEKEFRTLVPAGRLVNVGHGALVDTEALIAALHAGEIFGAGLDVLEVEALVPQSLANQRHVVLTPHIGAATLRRTSTRGPHRRGRSFGSARRLKSQAETHTQGETGNEKIHRSA